MKTYNGEVFAPFFDKFLHEYSAEYGEIASITCIGFCFGGSVATYSALRPEVTTVCAFYPGQNHTPNFHDGQQTIVEAITENRKEPLELYGFYGVKDTSISEKQRDDILDTLAENEAIEYHEYLFDAGHAFMNSHRPTFVPEAAQESLEIIHQIIR